MQKLNFIKKLLFLIFFSSIIFAHDAPYALQKFRQVLDNSKLQAPKSPYNPRYSVKYGEFRYFSNRYFYLQDAKFMVFFMCGKKNRSELRFKDEWRVETKYPKIIRAKLYLFPLDQKKEFTFLQIHANSNRTGINGKIINKPLLRLTWWKEQKSKRDHLWAVIRLSGEKNEQLYEKIDLGKRPKDFFTVSIEVQNSRMRIYLNKKLKIDKNVSYWNGYWNYFKAGVYLQGDGCSKVLFENLSVQ
ncbi:polysaccharide lyase family 7 protein [Nitrosophilus labii]|uniref:polysaccharide lyase family 7 protein n=1 Tax=Nitrosophilus labii TaxID=2706014 RepID=UPI00165752A7|nr:polysaccharide lyase family 7 protein [Nitrosophilus labii]